MTNTSAYPEGSKFECKHATYVRAQDGSRSDLLAIKEVVHCPDGTFLKGLRLIENMQRDFYVTHKGRQTYTQKKDYEPIENLQRYACTQAELTKEVNQVLNGRAQYRPLRELARSPYLYGADIKTTALVKHHYQARFPNTFVDNTVAVLDIETDVVHGHKKVLCVALTFKERAFLAVTEAFIGEISHFEQRVQEAFTENLGQYQKERQIKLEVLRVKTPGQACYEAIQRAHQWAPDFVTIWNMDFDIPKIIQTLKEEHYDIGDVFSDPCIPKRYRYANYKPGMAFKRSASGKHQPLGVSQRWHTLIAPASFYVIDSMCLFRQLRLGQQQEPSYALDSMLNKYLGIRKLKFDDRLDPKLQDQGIEWHRHMQRHHRVEYTIYNLFDCISVELFDEKFKDLAQSISIHSGFSDYGVFNSQPKRLVDKLHVFYLERGQVISTRSDQVYDEHYDSKTVSRDGWIVTLATHLMKKDGKPVLEEAPQLPSTIFTHVSDLD
jgi:hypothetical protein